jgi:hypothetical protein
MLSKRLNVNIVVRRDQLKWDVTHTLMSPEGGECPKFHSLDALSQMDLRG